MHVAYAGQVERLREGTQPTPLAISVAAWTQRHLSEPMDTEKLARELHYSRPPLSRKFRKETGMTPYRFHPHEKSEEAACPLAYTDKSLIAISD